METRWDNFQVPETWTTEETQALQRFRVLCEQQYTRPLGLIGFARELKYPKGDSLYQILKAGQKVGNRVLKRLHEAGYDAASIFPEHEYIVSLTRQNQEVRLPLIPLMSGPAAVSEAPAAYTPVISAANDDATPTIIVYAQPSDIPAGCFAVRAPDDPMQRVLWVCDPNFSENRGNRPLIIRTASGLIVCPAYQICNDDVYATVIFETMEVHSIR